MKYLCLIYIPERELAALSPQEQAALWSECEAYSRELSKSPAYLGAEALESVAAATTLRRRNGALTVTDGPFAETKEQLGGYLMIEAANLDEALKVAAGIPGARHGSVEVRPIRSH
jgi:hypothetical protein